MLSDPYITSSNFRPQKGAANCNVKEFYEIFEKYYKDIRSGRKPDLPHKICDPYGFALLCKDYEDTSKKKIEENIDCKESFVNTQPTIYDSIFKHKFPFEVLLNLLHGAYLFNYELAIKVYSMQHSAFDIFNQIMNGQGYVINRLSPNKKKIRKLINNAYNSKISLNENKYIPVPYINRVCDGKVWPCIITKNPLGFKLKKLDIGGYGEGLFLLGAGDDLIYDVLKINDLWLVDTPLDNRLKFGSKAKSHDVAEYGVVYSWRTALEFGRLTGCNKTDGLLIRPCHEDFFSANWFGWSKTSLMYCCLINGKLQIANRKSSEPDYYTLEGDLGEVDPRERRVFERIWLDDFDIKEFQQILKLRD